MQVEFQYLQLLEWPRVDHPGDSLGSLLSHGERLRSRAKFVPEHFSLRQSRPESLDKEVQVTTSNFAKDMSDFLLSAHPDPGWLLIEEGIEPAREHEIEVDSCDSQWISRHEGVSR